LSILARKSEIEWIDYIRNHFKSSNSVLGIGDDCSIIKCDKNLALTSDVLIEGIDFKKSWAPFSAFGWKSLAVNLSDLSSMGAEPLYFLLDLAIPKKISDYQIEDFLKGIESLSKLEGIELIGGDLSKSPSKFFISITAIGVVEGKLLLRGKAKVGDFIYLTEPIGGADLALNLFKKGSTLDEFPLNGKVKLKNKILDRFFRPPSQTSTGISLSRQKIASSAIDISDGLLVDLSKLISGSGAILEVDKLPKFDRNVSLKSLLYGGEEQTLIFTISKSKEYLLSESKIKCFKIGEVIDKKGIFLKRGDSIQEIMPFGFDHFSKNRHFLNQIRLK